MAEFDLEMVDDYKEMKVAEVAARGWLDKSCPTACNVMKLIELFEETDQEAMRDLLIQILFENTVLTTAEEKQNVQEILETNVWMISISARSVELIACWHCIMTLERNALRCWSGENMSSVKPRNIWRQMPSDR